MARLEGVRRSGRGYMARCPAHDDRRQSLSLSTGAAGQVLLYCHAGCNTEAVLEHLGLTPRDLFPPEAPRDGTSPREKDSREKNSAPPREKDSREKNSPPHREKGGKPPAVVAVYDYRDEGGKLVAQKLRRADKSFTWRRPDGQGGWVYNRQGVPHRLYLPGGLSSQAVFVTEGEKDADSLHRLGYCAASAMDGAGDGKWHKEYTEQLRGCSVCILGDNDPPGKQFAKETAAALWGAAESVRILDLAKVWPEIPEKGDVSDLIEGFGDLQAVERITALVGRTGPWQPAPDPFLSCFKTIDCFDEEEAAWLVPGWIPEGQITLVAADGGIGKTTVWCHLIAALSSGSRCMLDPPGYQRQPKRVAFLTTEDSVRKKLRKKLRLAGARMDNIITPDFLADKDGLLRGLKFGSPKIDQFVRHFRPALCVFDPVQGFVPPDINMGSRNAMRDCMAPLVSLGEECGTTFLVICHTNKRKGASGRDRIADSADLWDVSRSVLMAGYTEEQGIRYLSNEKNNYAPLHETLLFSIDPSGQAKAEGTTWKRDREFAQEAAFHMGAPKREDCKALILRALDEAGGTLPSKELEEKAKRAGYSTGTLRRAKDELKQSEAVKYEQTGSAQDKVWHVRRLGFGALPADTPTPWTQEPPPGLIDTNGQMKLEPIGMTTHVPFDHLGK